MKRSGKGKLWLWFVPFLLLIVLQPIIITLSGSIKGLIILLELILLTIVFICAGIIYKYFKKKFSEINELSGQIEVLDE